MRIFSLLTFITLCTVFSLSAQEPVLVRVQEGIIGHVRADCPNMFAGNARLAITTDGESLSGIDSIVLCAEDGVVVNHQGNYNVDQDPDPTTQAGVLYAVFRSEPTSTNVMSEPELQVLPGIVKLSNGSLIFARADANGNMTIINDGSFLAAAGLSAPVKLWFAPITVHNISANLPEDFFENADACIHINSSSAFSVTYLSALDFTVSKTSETTGTITVSGGIPELDGSDYSVTLTNLSTGASVPVTSGGNPIFDYTLPSANAAYRITISDKQGCSMSRTVSFLDGPPIEVHVPDTTANPGEKICLPLTAKDFNNIATFSFVVKWNPRIIKFDSINFINPMLKQSGNDLNYNVDFSEQGIVIFIWVTSVLEIDIPDDETIVELCFTAVGGAGQKTEVTLGPYKSTPIDFTDQSHSVNFTINDGSVTIVPANELDFTYSACEDNLSIQVFGGKGPYSYRLSGASTDEAHDQTDQFTISGLNDGNYMLEITDASGASATKNISIQSTLINPGVRTVANSCSLESPNGYAYLTDPPTGRYQTEWTYNDQTFYNVDTLRDLAGGKVQLTIIDENNCRTPAGTYDIMDNSLTATGMIVTPPGCDGTAGSVRIEISGGNPDYEINYNGDIYGPGPILSIPMFRSMANYNIRDINKCAFNLAVTSSVTGGETFTLNSEIVTNINCENEDYRRGQYRGNVSSSNPGSHFKRASLFFGDGTQVNGINVPVPNPLTGAILAFGLEEAEYYWLIEGECGDTTFAFTIEDLTANPPSVDATITGIGCGSNTDRASISLEVFPAGQNYTYNWNTGATTSAITDLDTGFYTVTVTDTVSKCSTPPLEYNIQPGIVLSKIEATIPCDVDTMVNVGVTIKEDYESILWDSGEKTEIITVSTPGYYPFTITPKDPACSPYRDSIYIRSQTGGIQLTGLNMVLVDGCGEPEVIVVAYLSEPKNDFGFSWDDGPVVLGENEYRIYDDEVHNLKIYKDDCIAIDTNFSYVFTNIIKIDTTVHQVDCFGNNNGQITVLASGGGSNNFRYEFNHSGRLDFFASYTDLSPGTYPIRVIDQTPPAGSPCPPVNLTFTITEPEPFTVAVDSSQVSPPQCTGESNGTILLVTTGGNPGTKEIRYNFSGGAKRTTELLLDSLKASNYMIRVEDSLGCVANTEFLLEDPDPVNFPIPPIEEPECAGYTTMFTLNNATGGTGSNYQYSVDGGVPVPLGEPLDILAGDHMVTVFDGNLCTVTNPIFIREPSPIVVDFNLPDTIQASLGVPTEIAAQISGDNPINDYIWTPAPLDSFSMDNTVSFTAADNVTVSLEVVDSRGCIGSNQVFVLVRKKRDVGIPNAFSPNGDGHNDLLTIIPGPAVRSIKNFQVYDRYGTLMWEESDISPAQAQIIGWDGTYSGRPAMFDVYVALVRIEYIDGQIIQRVADVTLIK